MNHEEVKTRLRPFGIVFERSLHDLIRGIRSQKEPEALQKFLQDVIAECRREVKSPSMELKTMAVLKLAYLEMYGFDMSWANFSVLEIMSSGKFQQKRVGYLAAIQSFGNDSDVLMLTTNLLKKDLNSSRSAEAGVAISGISAFVTGPLAADIADDLVKMLTSSKPYIRKKAVCAMYNVFLKYPQALKTHLHRVLDRLDDEDSSVVTAAVTVVCELSKKTPKLLVATAPKLYDLLNNTATNNWLLIRILKIFSSLSLTEPRLKTKLLSPILDLMARTDSSSLIYECINCIVTGDMLASNDYHVANLCIEELVNFFDRNDSNLKFIGLLAFYKIGQINPRFIAGYHKNILEFLADSDLTIREKSLDLVQGIVTDENLFDIVKTLMVQLLPDEDSHDDQDTAPERPQIVLSDHYKTKLIKVILTVCSADNYTYIPSFEWYVTLLTDLIDLAIVHNLPELGSQIGEQFRDIAMRVPSLRKLIVLNCCKVVVNDDILARFPLVLKDLIWIIGEYSSFIKNSNDLITTIISQEIKLKNLDEDILKMYVPCLIKMLNSFINSSSDYWDPQKAQQVTLLVHRIIKFFEILSISKYFEIQERSVEFLEFLKLMVESIEQHDNSSGEAPMFLTVALPSLFNAFELNPISQGSQRRITQPDDLDLDSPIHEGIFDSVGNESENETDDLDEFEEDLYAEQVSAPEEEPEESAEDILRRKMERQEKLKDDPYYLTDKKLLVSNSKEFGSMTPRSFTPTLIEMNEDVIQSKKKSKKKKKRKDVVILTDEVINSGGNSIKSQESASSGVSKKAKNDLFRLHESKLEQFDVEEDPVGGEEEASRREIEKIRQQLEQQELPAEDEEVVIVRKKKKKKDKKDKKDKKEHKKKGGDESQ